MHNHNDNRMLQRIAILYHEPGFAGELGQALAGGFRNLGYHVDLVAPMDPWHEAYDLVVGYGPHQVQYSMIPAMAKLHQASRSRPLFFFWCTEAMPNHKRLPLWIIRILARVYSDIRYAKYGERSIRHAGRRFLEHLLPTGFRFQVMGEIMAFQTHGLLDGLAVTSPYHADLCMRLGLGPCVIPIGYQPAVHGRDLGLERDIDVAFLGRIHGGRREQNLRTIQQGLHKRGITLTIVRDHCDGHDRTELLNRTKIALNILQHPADFTGLRLMLSAANKALIVSEPMYDSGPFESGKHLIDAPICQMAETIGYYLKHEMERQTIVNKAHDLVMENLTMDQTAQSILRAIRLPQDT